MASGQMRLDVGDSEPIGYRGPTACSIVGITYRQLDYWARTGLVEPTVRRAEGSGSQRLFSFGDIVRLRVVKRLLDTGVSLQRVRVAIEALQGRGHTLSDVTLMSDGSQVFMVTDDDQVIDLVRGGQAVFAIALGPVIEELEGEVTAFPTVRAEPIMPTDSADGTGPDAISQ